MPTARTSPRSDRTRLLAEGAIEVLAAQGAHGLTHRRLDRHLDLPEGSTSNVFRTREALLSAALDALVGRDLGDLEGDADPTAITLDDAGIAVADAIFTWLDPQARPRLVARYELMLESARRPELQATFLAHRARFTAITAELARAAGCDRPDARAAEIVAWADGVLLEHIVAPRSALTREAVAAAARRLLAAD